ncbi:hypothetical protein [Fictibacillus fluitans]|uniref:DUF1579 domain-containing protein n=1 Tax=Fictibacillus fluitans TaxID=3058422 RepID=A0ABT8I076_9BACL|nr:hypothetical protein [Fictibacillus sp. NE201]MDN4526373.1 hypothetical protein [Fictibacillus sp. NE201]
MKKKDAGESQQPYPYPGLECLERLVGRWKITGPEIAGEVSYEWMDGGFFLIQRFDLIHNGRKNKGIEIIGYTKKFFAESPSEHLKSRIYDNHGSTFDYTYEVDENSLTIWGGEKGSPAYYKGIWSEDGSTNSGCWVYPGGGYESTMTRINTQGASN